VRLEQRPSGEIPTRHFVYKEPEKRRLRDSDVRNIVFAAFTLCSDWSAQQLAEYTDLPLALVKQCLAFIAEVDRDGRWTLLRQYNSDTPGNEVYLDA